MVPSRSRSSAAIRRSGCGRPSAAHLGSGSGSPCGPECGPATAGLSAEESPRFRSRPLLGVGTVALFFSGDMRNALGMSTTLLPFSPLSFYPTPTGHFLVEAWWTCYSSPPHTWRQRSDAILATGLPLTVIPFTIRNLLDLEITPTPGWKGFAPTWLGVPCLIGRVTLWIPIQEIPGHFRSFSLLTLFPQQDVPDTPPFVQLGAQFLLEHRVQVFLDGSAVGGNRLVIP